MTDEDLRGCPIEMTLSIIGGKWKGIIMYHLMKSTTIRFNELQRMLPGATPRMLTKQLRELEQDGVIHREIYPQVPPKVEYSLTDFGQSLTPILTQMETWGLHYMSSVLQESAPSTEGSTKRVSQIKQSILSTKAEGN
ncbi:MAG: helix-turn-helix domain-containing protein [Chloroflexota bacterium]